MKTMNQLISLFILGAVLLISIQAQADDLQTLKNLERERSNLITTLLDENLEPEQRHKHVESKVRRLVDLERIVMRDTRLEGNTHFLVRRAYKDYDLTFLTHASVEKKQAVVGLWVNQIGLSDTDILTSTRGIR
mgnify:CR=1 FL=1